MIIPINHHLKLVKSKQVRFPYCYCVLIEDQTRVLIDSGCSSDIASDLKEQGLDIIINTHFHWDHTRQNQNLGEVQIWCHSLDAPGIRSADIHMERYGYNAFAAEDMGRIFLQTNGITDRPVHRELRDGETLDLGKVHLRVIHTPGHTPGHCVLLEEHSGILISGDIDLSAWGPWYLHICSDLDDYISSIERCMELKPNLVISGHKGIVEHDLRARFMDYRDRILRKEEEILGLIDRPVSLEELGVRGLFYGSKTKSDRYLKFREKQGVYLHLQRLMRQGLVKKEADIYYRI
ncbi:hypothetical protein ASZ90_019634 [hydrocarbon metagenome]|uniref:Metallo-beta-lactamase domain-containing protein n=1 Tax=hydrocarbon metagenome TaxID=938273 RepID=A0A0W8E2X8_9ZZZZ